MPQNKQLLANIASYVVSAVIGAVVSAFILGRNAQKINDVVHWKAEMAPRIERMDSTGTISFDLFHKEYLRTQARQESELNDLEKEMKQLERNKQ